MTSSPVSRTTRPRESISLASESTMNSTGPELGWHEARYPVTRAPVSYSIVTRWLIRSCSFE